MGGGVAYIIDLRHLNHSLRRFSCKMLTIPIIVSRSGRIGLVCLVCHEDWFVMIDLKVAYFHISIHPLYRWFLRFPFGGEVFDISRCRSWPYKTPGVKRVDTFTENDVPGGGVGFNAGTIVYCMYSPCLSPCFNSMSTLKFWSLGWSSGATMF